MTRASRQAAIPFILVTVFLDVLGIGLIIPVLPAFIAQFTTSREAQAHWYGVLAASYGLMQFFAAPALGALSDRFGRRPVLLLSMMGLGVNYLLAALAPSIWFLLVARLIGGLTGASFSVAGAYVADITEGSRRGKSFGIIGAAFGMGFIFGPVVGGVLGNVDLRLPYLVAAGLSAINTFYGFFILPESLPKDRRVPFAWARSNPFTAIFALVKLRAAGSLIFVIGLTALSQFILQTTFVLFTTFRFNWQPRDNGFALFVVGVVAAVVQGGLLGFFLKHLGERRVVLLGLSSGVIAYFLYGSVLHGWMIYVIIAGNFLSFATAPALQGIISRAVGDMAQGITMGSINSLNSVMLVIAPLIGAAMLAQGAHWAPDDWRVGAVFYLASFLQAIALVLAWRHFAAIRAAGST